MVEILDSTLREGEQTPYVNFLIDEKIEIAKMLDQVGVEMIEAGDPSVSENIYTAIKRIAALRLNAEIIAHSMATKVTLSLPDPAFSSARSTSSGAAMETVLRPKW